MARSALLNVMTNAAMKAGRSLSRNFGEVQNLQVSRKGPADFVSEADIKAEKIVREELWEARPKFGFLMEERGEIAGEDRQNRWIVDGLDGTTNFLHGNPHFCISIALEREGEIVAGVVYTPISDELFVAEKGQGAYANDTRMRVSGRKQLRECLIGTYIPQMGKKGHAVQLREQHAMMRETAGVRCSGSTALDLAYVAAGRLDGIWQRGPKAWDVAAGMILMRESGGFITDIDGEIDMLQKGSVLAGNEFIHREMLKLLKETAK